MAANPPSGNAGTAESTAPAMSLGGLATFANPDNTSVHAAVLVTGAFAVILFLYWGGFKFAVDAGVTRP